MVLSTQTEVGSKRLGDEKCVRMICEAGFDALDYSMFCMQADDNILNQPTYLEHVFEVKKIVESYGKYFNQAHAPFPSFKVGEDTYNTVILEKIKRSIEIAGTLGAKNIVIHPTYYGKDSKRNLELNAEFYNNLIPLCKEYNIKIACENMFGRDRRRHCIIPNICSVGEEFKAMMDMLDPRYFTACVDTQALSERRLPKCSELSVTRMSAVCTSMTMTILRTGIVRRISLISTGRKSLRLLPRLTIRAILHLNLMIFLLISPKRSSRQHISFCMISAGA